MELDTGSRVSIISLELYNKQFSSTKLVDSKMKLTTYSGELLKPHGVMNVTVEYKDQKKRLKVYVISGVGPPLLGRDWLTKIRLDWSNLVRMDKPTADNMFLQEDGLPKLCEKYSEVFTEELGTMKGIKAKLVLKDESHVPKFVKARPVPYALQDRVNAELTRMEEAGIIKKVQFSNWAAPIVPVVKPDHTVRVCGDFKVTVNPLLNVPQHPLPRADDIFASLAGGERFTKIDLAHAYQQMLLEEESKAFLTINTQKGLYQYTRLAFGVASAPALFQSAMDQILVGIPKVVCYLDDILVTGATDEEHLSNLEAVLKRLQEHGLRVKKKKCSFFSKSVTYLGHKIDKEGLHTSNNKVKDLVNTDPPENLQQLRSYLGLVNYYGKFIPNLSTVLHPLNELSQKSKKWEWSSKCDEAFKKTKELITDSHVLVHYDPTLPVVLATDASPYGVGVVISHIMKNGDERPIAFAFRTLSKAEKGY